MNVVKPFFLLQIKKNMDSRKRAHPMSDETRERLVELEARNDVLSERLAAYESHIKDLEAFKANHQKVWGALTAEELVLFAKSERQLLEESPSGFVSKLHDALFCRKSIEDLKSKHRVEMDIMAMRVQLAEEGLPRMQEEVAKLRRLLSDQKHQTEIQNQRANLLEEQLKVVQIELQRCDANWRRTGQQKSALEAKVDQLVQENLVIQSDLTRMTREVTEFRSDAGWSKLAAEYEAKLLTKEAECEARRKEDIDSVTASLFEQLRAKGRAQECVSHAK